MGNSSTKNKKGNNNEILNDYNNIRNYSEKSTKKSHYDVKIEKSICYCFDKIDIWNVKIFFFFLKFIKKYIIRKIGNNILRINV